MKYSYKCGCANSTEISEHKCGEAPDNLGECPFCQQKISRDLAADLGDVVFGVVDAFRSYALSTAKSKEEARQERHIGGPQDSFERKYLEKTQGIQYVGNDTSGFTAKAQRGIEQYADKKAAGLTK